MSKRDKKLLLIDMLDSAIKIKTYVKGIGFKSFMSAV